MKSLFKKKDKHKASSPPSSPVLADDEDSTPKRQLLVIDSDSKEWHKYFKDRRLDDGSGIEVHKTRWENMIVMAEGTKRPMVNMKPNLSPLPGTKEGQYRQVQPDFALVRKLVRGLTPDEDYTNTLYGLMFSNVPAVNSFESVHQGLERPVVYAALQQISRRVGHEHFPLIPMTYYSHQTAMMFTPEYPLVVKVGYAEAGYGKVKFDRPDDLKDFRGVLALHKDYVTAEPYIKDKEYDIRVQKIGDHIRVYKRTSENWKGNVGTSHIEELPVTPEFQLWATECGKLFGGMDILTVDAVHCKGRNHILEINDTASGFYGPNEDEDMKHVVDLVVQRMNKTLTDQT